MSQNARQICLGHLAFDNIDCLIISILYKNKAYLHNFYALIYEVWFIKFF